MFKRTQSQLLIQLAKVKKAIKANYDKMDDEDTKYLYHLFREIKNKLTGDRI